MTDTNPRKTEYELPYDLDKYFLKDEHTIELSLDKLVPLRSRPEGIVRANKYMFDSYTGQGEKRKPITVRQGDDGIYSIIDGNSTYANAKTNGWPTIYAHIAD